LGVGTREHSWRKRSENKRAAKERIHSSPKINSEKKEGLGKVSAGKERKKKKEGSRRGRKVGNYSGLATEGRGK